MIQSFLFAWKNVFEFKGKTIRKDYWFYQLANLIILILLSIIENLLFNLKYFFLTGDPLTVDFSFFSQILAVLGYAISIFSFFYSLGSLIVTISISIRRLNDISKDWAWIFIQIIPLFGTIYFIYLMCQPSIQTNLQEK